MALFQQSVLQRYLDAQAQANKTLDARWKIYSDYFLNEEIQTNIRAATEIQYQGEFLNLLFVNVLGYIRFPMPNFTLKTEYRNAVGNRRVDCAIFVENNVCGVIELKDTNTTNLDTIEDQAFGYKNRHRNCIYVVTSNFEKLRFYIDDAVEYIEFNLFKLTREVFNLLYLCLGYENIAQDIPKKMKEGSSADSENEITQKLYRDYSTFKKELYENILQLNYSKPPCILLRNTQKLTAFNLNTYKITARFTPDLLLRKTQKLLDRFLFLCFAEDKLLVPSNSVKSVLDRWKKPHWIDDKRALYDMFKKYFNYLNTGFNRNNHIVFNYNGGLFRPDAVLDMLKIDNNLLYSHTKKLAYYNFASEVDVNILGRIFENSLNSSRRKTDGIFYTPKYITKYIVENTIGKLCQEQKEKLEIREEDFAIIPLQTKNKKEKELFEKEKSRLNGQIETYREWLLQLTILDPACGSGAFLNEALQFLIEEHKFIHDLKAKISHELPLDNIENTILENNIFGVDLNEESVEIAKLSLWLRTARKGRQLSSLTNNIKCGNSLIDDAQIAGNKAFNWQENFPQVFEKGGFDVVIGNPPYVLCQQSNTAENVLKYYHKFKVASYKIDLFHLFFEKAIQILKKEGKLGFITPNTYLANKYTQKLRNFILQNTYIEEVINYTEPVFNDAGVDVATIVLSRNEKYNTQINIYHAENEHIEFAGTKSQTDWNNDKRQVFNLKKSFSITFNGCIDLGTIANTYFGIQAFDRNSSIFRTRIAANYLSVIDGEDISRYNYAIPSKFFHFIPQNIKSGGNKDVYSKERIVIRQIGEVPIVGFCEANILTSNTIYNIFLKNINFDLKYILAILSSTLIKKYWLAVYNDNAKLFPRVRGYQLKELPIKEVPLSIQQPFIEKSNKMLSLNKQLNALVQEFRSYIMLKFAVQSLPEKLQNWHLLSYADFIGEVQNKKISFSFSKLKGFQEEFDKASQEAKTLADEISQTDQEIDQMVYELYELTPEEIAIVEKG